MFKIDRAVLDHLFEVLIKYGYQPIGPVVRNQVIAYEPLTVSDDLPIGWTDEQEKGTYRLKRRKDKACFGYVVGPQSWKKFLFPPRVKLWQARKSAKGMQIEAETPEIPKYAFIGVRPCEIAAMRIQDRVFMEGHYVDPYYHQTRENSLVVAVNCSEPGQTCFCTSMQTGPRAEAHFDIALTEVIDKKRHYFLAEAGSEKGREILKHLSGEPAGEDDVRLMEKMFEAAEEQMGRQLDTRDIRDLLYQNLEDPHWDEIANRCLSCANCTMVCPTCFCSTVEDTTDLTGETATRERRWDSCFTGEFSYIHGGNVRDSAKARYRQWMTHKLAGWVDQFDTSGCVGCGRCITWCPVGIDITEETVVFRDHASKQKTPAPSRN